MSNMISKTPLSHATQRVVVHIGLPTSASTFLQFALFPRIADTIYIGRPYTQLNHAFNQLQYADDSIYDRKLLQVEFQRMRDLCDEKIILISDEALCGFLAQSLNRTRIADRLMDVAPQAEIVVVVRNQTDLVASLYNQQLKKGKWVGRFQDGFLHAPGTCFSLEEWNSGSRAWSRSRRFVDPRSFVSVPHLLYGPFLATYMERFSRVHVFLIALTLPSR